MSTDTFKVTIHMVSSLDGIIAKKDNSVSWFETVDHYEKGVADPDAAAFLKTIDCYIMGARTYEHALELSRSYGWVYGDIPTIVLSHRKLPVERNNVELYSGDLNILVQERLRPHYKNVWLVGGADLSMDFIRLNLADDIRLSIIPILLGEGTRFFDHIGHEKPLHLRDVSAYKNGIVSVWYEIRKDQK